MWNICWYHWVDRTKTLRYVSGTIVSFIESLYRNVKKSEGSQSLLYFVE